MLKIDIFRFEIPVKLSYTVCNKDEDGFNMKNEKHKAFQLIETPAVEEFVDYKNVFSIIELTREGEDVRARLYYDVTRIKEKADEILEQIDRLAPVDLSEVIEDFLSL